MKFIYCFLFFWAMILNTATLEELDINCKPVQEILYDQEGSTEKTV
jgi:hypothetical protein